MSLVAVANLLKNDIFQRRFLKDHQMDAARELLEEKIPSGAVVFEDIDRREVPQKPGRAVSYTHLDVYKRQGGKSAANRQKPAGAPVPRDGAGSRDDGRRHQ